jgi:carboxymethylenebutenolidase
MCYGPEAQPPHPPISGGAGTGSIITLTSADGTDFAAFLARPEDPPNAGIVVLPDVRGLHSFYEELAMRFAETGVAAVAIDYFGRTAGVGARDDDFDFMEHVMKTEPQTIALDVAASLDHLRSEINVENLFTVGFCFGGRNSFNQAAEGHDLAGVIGFYGRVAPRDDEDRNAPVDRLDDYSAPVLGLFGGADQGIPPESVEEFRKALDAKGLDNELVIYDGAPHSFFDRAYEQFADECDDSWRRILEFIKKHSA